MHSSSGQLVTVLIPSLIVATVALHENISPNVCIPIMSTVIIFIGSQWSQESQKDGSEIKQRGEEAMSMRDALTLPIVLGVVLVGLQCLVKQWSPEWTNFLMRGQFFFVTLISIPEVFALVVKTYAMRDWMDQSFIKVSILNGEWGDVNVTLLQAIGFIPVLVNSGLWIHFNFHICNNFIAVAISIYGIMQISLGSFKTAFTALSLLFFQDIQFVFQTPIMVDVATKLDVPVKLIFQRLQADGTYKMGMLGLGDIVLPGMLVAQCLRYDLVNKLKKKATSEIYFIACLIGYVAGILISNVVAVYFKRAQPALLYLVPCTIIPVLLTAIAKGSLAELWDYDEQSVIENKKTKTNDEKKK